MTMPGRSYAGGDYRYGFNGMEGDHEIKGGKNSYDFGARILDPRIGRWLSVDPDQKNYPGWSSYVFVRDNPSLLIDPTGKWDVEVHVYKDREKYGYGVAIVKDRHGKEVYRFDVRVEGAGGRNRMIKNSDTPLGTYDIPDKAPWMSGGDRNAYGPNHRLVMTPQNGEILESGRSDIRIHGGRQETYNASTGKWEVNDNPVLKKTHGCLRTYDSSIKQMKEITDALENADPEEFGGTVTIIDDLIEKDGRYEIPSDLEAENAKAQEEINTAIENIEKSFQRDSIVNARALVQDNTVSPVPQTKVDIEVPSYSGTTNNKQKKQ